MKIIRKKRRKGKVGISFRRTTKLLKQEDWDKQEMIKALCFTWNSFTYESFKEYMARMLHTRKEEKKKNLPLVIVGDAKFPPLIRKIKRYYLSYNPRNFIGEYEMGLYNENCFLIFHLNYPEEFDKYKEIAHRIIYLGSLCQIVFLCASDAVLPERLIQKESLTDYHIWIIKDSGHYVPYNNNSDSFIYSIPKKL